MTPQRPKRPTPADLAGIPFEAEGKEDTTIRPRPAHIAPRPPSPPLAGPPTPENLAGIAFTAEGEADTTIRPRRRKES